MIYPLHGKEEELMEAPVAFGIAVDGCRENCVENIQEGGELCFKTGASNRGGNDVGRDVARGVERWEYGNEHSSEDVLRRLRRKER